MSTKAKRILGITLGAIALVMISAGASALLTQKLSDDPKEPVVASTTTKKETIHWREPAPPQQQPQRVAAACDDGNVIGYGLGALAGGLIGHQIGDGKGKDVATIGGAAAGALAGGQYIPTRGALCPK